MKLNKDNECELLIENEYKISIDYKIEFYNLNLIYNKINDYNILLSEINNKDIKNSFLNKNFNLSRFEIIENSYSQTINTFENEIKIKDKNMDLILKDIFIIEVQNDNNFNKRFVFNKNYRLYINEFYKIETEKIKNYNLIISKLKKMKINKFIKSYIYMIIIYSLFLLLFCIIIFCKFIKI